MPTTKSTPLIILPNEGIPGPTSMIPPQLPESRIPPTEDILSVAVLTMEEVPIVRGRVPEGNRGSRSYFLASSANRNSKSQFETRFEILSHENHNNIAAQTSAGMNLNRNALWDGVFVDENLDYYEY